MSNKYKWVLNASTGDHIHDVDDNTRIIRLKGGGLYIAEYWGDYNDRRYPISGNVEKTPKAALESLNVTVGLS